MHADDQLSRLIADVYDAALDAARWGRVLEQVRDFVGGSAATIFAKDASRKCGSVYYQDGVDPHYTRLYFDEYVKLDPLTIGHVFAQVEQPVATADIMPYEDFLETRVYREWVRPQGFADFVSAVLDKSETSAAIFGVFRSERVDDEARLRMRMIVPHIRRAVLISRMIDLKTAEADTFADTLDGLSAGMFLVDQAGRLVHANASGRAMLAQGAPVRASAGKLVAGRANGRQLDETFGATVGGSAVLAAKGIAVPLDAADGERYSAHVLPLTSGERRRIGGGSAATAALFVHKVAVDAPAAPEIIARTYGLTPTELRVLL